MSPDSSVRPVLARLVRRALPWALALAVATCTDDSTGPSKGGVGYFSFRPVYSGVASSLSQFGIVADSVHVLLTRPVDQVVLDTTVFFPPDSLELRMALPVELTQSPETLTAMIEIKAGGVVLFVDTLDVQVIDGPPNASSIATATLDYVGPGNNIAAITVAPADTTIAFGDTLFYTTTAVDSSDAAVLSYYVAWKTSDTAVAKVNAQGRLIAPNVRGTLRVIGYTPTGIADTADITFAPVPSQILADSGAAQSGAAGDSLAQLFVAQVRAADNLPVEGIYVRFTASAGGAVRDTLLVTDVNGRVRTRGLLGSVAGPYTWTATIVGTAISTTFTGTAAAGAPTAIAISSGNAQVDTAGRVLPLPLSARVADAFDNPVAGSKVYWARTFGTGAVAADSSFTNASGIATIGYTLGAVGVDSISATIAGTGASVLFHAEAVLPSPASIVTVAGDSQSIVVNTESTDTIAVLVRDAQSAPIAGVQVDWAVLPAVGDMTVIGQVFPGRNLTDSLGIARVVLTAGTLAQTVRVLADVGDLIDTVFTFQVAAAPSAIAMVAGDAQTDTAGFVLPTPFVVRAADAFDNPVAGTKVYWTRVSGTGMLSLDSSFTNASGNTFAGYTLGTAGVDSIKAELAGTGAFVWFTVTTINGAPAVVAEDLGNAQSDTVGRQLADSFAVLVQSANGRPVVGTPVVWTVLRGGSTSADTALTDADGRAAVAYTLGTLPGIDSVQAQAGSATTIFTATAAVAEATILLYVSGSGQTDTVGDPLALPFVVHATDLYGNAVTGAVVEWSVAAGTGILSADTVLTDGSGNASVSYILGPTPGADTVAAVLGCQCSTVPFFVTGIMPAPAAIQITSGDGQSAAVEAPLAQPLVATVLDASSNPMPGAQVVWTVLRGGSVVNDTVFSDGSGEVTALYTAGTQTGIDSIEVRALEGGVSTIFTATVTAGAPTSIFMFSGDGQSDTVGNVIPLPFVIAVQDDFGNGVPGAEVEFEILSGSGTLFGNTIFTDSLGHAAVGYLFGAIPGTDSLRATLVATGGIVDFTATGLPATPASIFAVSGDGQTAAVTDPFTDSLVVEVQDGGGTPVYGQAVVWTMASGGVLTADTTFTDITGRAWVRVTADTLAGSFTVEATAVGLALPASFTLNVDAGPASAIAIVSGNGQADTVGSTLPIPFLIAVTDAYGNPVSAATIAFTRTAGNGNVFPDTTFTDVNGQAQATYTLGAFAGTDTIVADLVGTGGNVTFTATGLLPVVATLADVNGNGAVDTVGQLLPDTLMVELRDGGGQLVAGTGVVWTVLTGGGSVTLDTTFTGVDGRASTQYILGTVVGTATIEARSVTNPVADTLTITLEADAPAAIAIQSGDGQVDTTNVPLPAPFVATVTDAYGNPVFGAAVVWQVTAGSGDADDDTTYTDVAGHTQVNYTVGGTPGTDTVRASLVGTSAFVDFTATVVSGAPAFLVKVMGDGQVDTVLATLADSFIVELRSANNSPVPNTWLYWVTGGATLSSDSTLTDGTGRAAVTVTLGSLKIPVSVLVFNADTTVATGFTVATRAGEATQITAVGGLGQSALVDSALPLPFAALVQDAYDNPVDSGVVVTWTNLVGFAAAGLPDTTATDSTGLAYLTAPLLGPVAGEDSLEAQILGVPGTAIFTATATPGAAGTLQYVSGTGQSQTVGTMLATQFNVQALDAGANPVGGTWVRWTVIAGGGSFPVDSSQTDLAGVAKITLTLGTVAGIDSAIATIDGSADTVVFYAAAVPDAPADLVLVSGDQQSGSVFGTLAAPMVVRVVDQYGNPVPGVSVDFGFLSGPGGGFANSSAATDSVGDASTGTVNLAATAGTSIVEATSTATPADTVRFVMFGLPAGTTKLWTGTASTDWGDDANWSPAGVPAAADNVFIAATGGNQPSLDISRTIAALQVESGADLNVQGNVLTLEGDLVANGTISRSSGHVRLAATTGTARGNLGAIEVTGDITLAGPSSTTDNTLVTAGALIVGGQTLDITGSLDVSGTGAFVMSTPGDSVTVTGTATFNGSNAIGNLTDGVLVLLGDFVEASAGAGFRATSAHRTRFAGSVPQSVTLTGAALGGDQFQDLEIANSAGVTFDSDVAIAGSVYADGPVGSATYGAVIAGALVDFGTPSWNVALTDFAGTATIGADTILGNVSISGDITLTQSLVVNGYFELSGTAFDLNTHRLDVGGQLTVAAGDFEMNNTEDTVFAHADVMWDGSSTTGLLSAGHLFIAGNFSETSASSTFQASGTHTTTFTGASAQTIAFVGGALGADQFQHVVFANPSGITLNSDIAVGGGTTISSGLVDGSLVTATLDGDLIGATTSTWFLALTRFDGSPSVMPDTINYAMEVTGSVTLPHSVVVYGELTLPSGSLNLGSYRLQVEELTVSGSGALVMQNPADTLDVQGVTSWGGSSSAGLLGAGTAIFRGNFTETSASPSYQAIGGHTTIFAGSSGLQTVSFTAPAPGGDEFRDVVFANLNDVDLASDIVVSGTATVDVGVVTGLGRTAILFGSLIDTSNTSWQIDTTELAGAPGTLPAALPGNLKVSANVDLPNHLTLGGSFVQAGGIFGLTGFTLRVDGALELASGAEFRMVNASDSLDVGGNVTWDGSSSSGLLVDGVAVFRGDFSEVSASSTYRESGSHRSIFAGSGAQTVTVTAPTLGGDQFENVTFQNQFGVVVSDLAAVDVTVIDGPVSSFASATVTIGDQLVDTSNTFWGPDLTRFANAVSTLPLSFSRGVEFAAGGTLSQSLVVEGQLTVSGGVFDPAGQPVRVESGLSVWGGAAIQMQNAADSIDVAGPVVWDGSTTPGYLTDGVLVLRGGFLQTNTSGGYLPTGSHRTVFEGGSVHAVEFWTPFSNGFRHLEIRGGGTLELASPIRVTGTLATAGAEIRATFGGIFVDVYDMAVDNITFDSVRVVQSGPKVTAFNNVTFTAQNPEEVQLWLTQPGSETAQNFTNVQFLTQPASGRYVAVTDSTFDGLAVTVNFFESGPVDGTPYEFESGSGDGTQANWSRLVFAEEPVGGAAGGNLSALRVALVDPAGDTATWFGEVVTVAIGTNPSGGTLSGTNAMNASGGIAYFEGLSIDLAGVGYTFVASSEGTSVTSAPFTINVPLPAGFDVQWLGQVSSDWNDPSNWSTASVPDSTTNVFISGLASNTPAITVDSFFVKRLQVAPGATLDLSFGTKLFADSSVEAFGTVNSGATIVLRGTGDITGDLGYGLLVTGDYAVAGTASGFAIDISGDLTLGADTLNAGLLLQTISGGELHMTDPATLVYSAGTAAMGGAQNSTAMSDGILRVGGDLNAYGSGPQGFTPVGNHVTEFVGPNPHNVDLFIPDTLTGSSFAHVRVDGTGAVNLQDTVDIRGDLTVVQGALSSGDPMGVVVRGGITIESGGSISLALVSAGDEIVNNGGSYLAGYTRYVGGGSPILIHPLPYDTLEIFANGVASGDFSITGDLRIYGSDGIGDFDLNGMVIGVAGSVSINGSGTLSMVNAADSLLVGGSFFTNGGSTDGHLTAGWLRIGGGFRQAADGSGEAFRAGPGHTTEFYTGAPTYRSIEFDSPSFGPGASTGSHFGALLLPIGYDTLIGRVPAAGKMFIAAATIQDTTFPGNMLVGYDSVLVSSASPSLQLRTLEVWGGLEVQGGVPYDVVNTRIMGGPNGTLAPLAYQNLLIANTGQTLGADLTLPGDLDVGIYCSEVCFSSGGDLTVNGFDLIIGGRLGVMGEGQLHMAAGDSVDVTGDLTYRTTPSAGNLTGGTLVARAMFNTVGANAYQPDAAHWTVLAAPGHANLYPTTGSRFGKLLVIDNGVRHIRSNEPVVVLDTLIIGTAATTLADTLFFTTGAIVAQGPVITVAGSSIQMAGSVRFDHNGFAISGSYSAVTTFFGGTGQTIPAIPLQHIGIEGTVQLGAPLDIGGNNFIINGNSGPADFDLNGFGLAVGYFGVSGQGTLTSTDVGSGLLVRSDAVFNGGDETGKLTEGGITIWGDFTQDTTFSLSSYVSTSNHTTVFADSSFGGSAVILNSMFAGNSRFNEVAVYGRGVQFYGTAWIDGDVNILAALVDSVDGPAARLGGSLNATGNRWKVDTTTIAAPHPLLPDSIAGNVIFLAPDSLEQALAVQGHLTIFDTLIPHPGGMLKVDSLFAATGNGLLVMTQPSQRVEIEGNAFFDGATSTGHLTAGTLRINGGLFRGATNPLAFDATGNHVVYIDSLSDGSVVNFDGPGGGVQNLQVGSAGLTLNSDLVVRGDLYFDGETPDPIFGGNHELTVYGLVEQMAIFENLRVRIPEQNTLFDVTFQNMDPTADQLTVFGDGSPEALQLATIRFLTVPTSGNLLRVVDTLADGDSLFVEMFSTTPAQGDSYTGITGDARATWPKLVLNTFPATVDSAVVFAVELGIMNPDSSAGNTMAGNVTIALEANPFGNTLGGTTNIGFGGVAALFNDLTLLLPGAGTSFRISIDGRPTDTLVTPTIQILNPAPEGAVVFDNQGGDNLWSTALNWSTDVVPDVTDSVFIPGSQFVQYDVPNDTVGTLVLGAGAQLDLAPSTNLTLTGRLTAGTTVTGSGDLVLAGSNTPVSGQINAPTTIKGTITTVGTVTFNNDLTVDGLGAELNIGGATVTVLGIFGTSNGGILTMDGATDSLIVGEAFFNGGSTAASLTAGVLVITGNDFTQGGDPASFAPSGTHLTVFEDAGDNSNAYFDADASFSYFQDLKVNTPNSLLLGSQFGRVRVHGDLTLDDDGAITGDSLHLDGTLTMGASSNVNLAQLIVGESPTLAGNYTVGQTWYFGAGLIIAVAPQGYQDLYLDNLALLGGSTTAAHVTVTGSGFLDINGYHLATDTLRLLGSGMLMMDAAQDSLVVNQFAQFAGASPAIPLTAGYLEIGGNFDVGENANMFQATAGHTTRFVGAANHLVDFPGEGQWTPMGTVVIDTGTVVLEDDMLITGDLILRDGSLADSTLIREVRVQGGINADIGLGTHMMVGEVTLSGGLTFAADSSRFDVNELRLVGTGQTLPGMLHYRTIRVRGTAALSAHIWTDNLRVDSTGVLDLNGFSIQADTTFNVTDNARLLMQDPADFLLVNGTATFQGDSSQGDYTAGTIRARHFVAQMGPSGDQRSFVQTGSNRIVPLSGDTISMWSGGPAGSMLKTLVLEGQGGPVYNAGSTLWIADSLVIVQLADSLVGIPGADVIVGFANGNVGTVHLDLGTLAVEALGVAGPLSRNAGTYDVQLTKFIGANQPIPGGFPFRDVEVQYAAFLTGDLTMTGAGQRFQVNNTGALDLAGNRLAVDTFSTSSFGILRMDDAADTLRADEAIFGGGSTVGTLTAGELEVGVLRQLYNADSTSFAASGTHQTTFLSLGGFTESGREVLFQTPHDTLSHFNRVRFLSNDGNRLLTNVYALDTVVINNSINQFSGVSLVSAGPVFIGNAADIDIDTLRMGDTLVIDPSATTFLDNWVFGPTAKTPPAWGNYSNVFLENSLTLQDSLHFPSGVTVRQGAVLTLNGNNFTTEYGFELLDSARLVMVAGDTLFTGHATFSAGPTGTDLAGGLIRMRGQFWQSPFGDPASFSPTGTVVEFAVNGGQSIQFNNPGSSYFRDLRIVGNTQMYINTPMTVEGDLDIDGTSGIFDWSNGNIDFMGKVVVASGGQLSDGDALTTLTFHDSLLVAGGATFNVFNAAFRGTNHLPALPYQWLILQEGTHDTLTTDITATNGLILHAGTPGGMDLVLNGNAITAGSLSVQAFGRFTMDNPLDSMVIASDAYFDGDDLTGRLTDGFLRLGGNVIQTVGFSTSNRSLRTDGVRVEFFGATSHQLTFATPDSSNSYIGNVAIQGGGNLFLNSGSAFKGPVDIGTSSTLDLGTLTSANHDFYGVVNVGASAALVNSNSGLVHFHDTLQVTAGATYNVVETQFSNVDTLPSVTFTNLYLGNGTSIVLVDTLLVTGQLTLTANAAGNQSLTLNGRKVSAGTFSVATNGRLIMQNPLDSLISNGDVFFDGADETGFLTAGTIYINNHFTQRATTSTSSGRIDGTKLLFNALTPVHIVDVISPLQSPVAEIGAINGSSLSLFLSNSLLSTGDVAHGNLQVMGVPTSELTADSIRATAGVLSITLPKVTAGYIGTSGPVSYTVATTDFTGNSQVPNLTYDTLIVSGIDTVGGGLTANHLSVNNSLAVGPGVTVNTTGDVVVAGATALFNLYGGTVNVGRDFVTTGGAKLRMDSTASALLVFRDAAIGGGSSIGLLNQGTLQVGNDFYQSGDAFSFVANPGHTTRFTGGNEHAISLANPLTTEFARIDLQSVALDADTLVILSSELRAGILKAQGYGWIRSDTAELRVQGLDVQGLNIERTQIVVNSPNPGPMTFNDVSFSGFDASNTQLEIITDDDDFVFTNVDFDNVADGTSGYFVRATDTDAVINFLGITIQGPDYLIGLSRSLLLGNATILFQPPS